MCYKEFLICLKESTSSIEEDQKQSWNIESI